MIGLNVVVLSHVFGSSGENTAAVADDVAGLVRYSVAIFVVCYTSKNLSSVKYSLLALMFV